MGNHIPVFGVSVSQLFYQFGMTSAQREGNTKLQLSSSYFNAVEGSWEPIVELFEVELLYKKQELNNCKDIQLNIQDDLNLNLTESLMQTIRDTF